MGDRTSHTAAVVLSVILCSAGAPVLATDLIDLYVQALELDPKFQSARLQVQVARETINDARSGMLPKLSLSAQNLWVNQDIRESDSILYRVGQTEYRDLNQQLTLFQPLYHPDTAPSMRQARSTTQQAGFELAAEEQDLIYRLADAHFTYLAARDELELAGAEKAALERQRSDARERLESGVGRVTAVSEAHARATLAEAAEIEAGAMVEAALQAIAEITGSEPIDLKSLSETFPLEPPQPADVAAWVDKALFQNPRIKALEARAEALEADALRERNVARQPSLDLTATLGNSDASGTEFGGGREILTGSYGFRLNFPIYDGGRGSAAIRASRLRHDQAMQAVEAERRAAARESRQAFSGLMSEIARAAALRQTVTAQEQVLREKEEMLGAGMTAFAEVLDATRELYSAQRDLAKSRYRYILNTLKLKQSAGTLGVEDLRWINAYLQ